MAAKRRGKYDAGVIAVRRWLGIAFWSALALVLLGGSERLVGGPADLLHRYTGRIEFDFVGWTLGAIGSKLGQSSVQQAAYLPEAARTDLVRRVLSEIDEAARLQGEIERVYADPAVTDPERESSAERAGLARLRRELAGLQPLVEATLQEQASVILADAGLTTFGAPIPPVSFQLSRLPMALVVSPRTTIRQEALIQLLPDMTIEQQVALENQVEENLGLSALVVPIGGIGTYPTMVQETTALDWLTEVVLHEWTHNYLTFRPLGWAYDASAETRTMNETTASLLGKALGRALLERYYPDLVPPPPPEATGSAGETAPPAFDFNAEMHETRVEVDRLLAEGKEEDAEAYMEARRQRLVEHGYIIRRLNQAYFAFHGAYADSPQSAAGADPVGEAVREMWDLSRSPAEFLRTMARMNSYEDLLRALGRPDSSRNKPEPPPIPS